MIRWENITKKYKNGTVALDSVNLTVEGSGFVFLVGPTGSGKTTLLRLVIRDILPSEGKLFIDDTEITKMKKGKIPQLRRKVGFIFQDLKLLSDRSVWENVILPLEILGKKKGEIEEKGNEVLKTVGIIKKINCYPVQLSGGELQRAAIARALISEPEIILADEPTADLDPKISLEIMEILEKINKNGTTIIMATHNEKIVEKMKKRVIRIEDGKIIKDQKEGKYD